MQFRVVRWKWIIFLVESVQFLVHGSIAGSSSVALCFSPPKTDKQVLVAGVVAKVSSPALCHCYRCCLSVLLYAMKSLVLHVCDIKSLNRPNCINTAVTRIFGVSFGNGVDFIRQMTGLTSFRISASERRSRFLSKLHLPSLFRTLMALFYDRMF